MSKLSSGVSTASDECYFLDLPVDIRNLIYNLVFNVQEGIHLDLDRNDHQPAAQRIFALSSTCKQIYYECKDLPYWLNTFHFHVPVLEEPKQLISGSRPYRNSTPIVLPLPQVVQSQCRKRHGTTTSGDISSPHRDVREKAQQFITLAMRLPHIDGIVSRLERAATHPTMSRLRKVHVHLGSQTRHPFIERFFTAWGAVVPALLMLSAQTHLRISFELRISKRLSVSYNFGVEETLREMDACVEAEEFTLSELAILNGIRVRVWGVFFGQEDAKPPAPFRPDYGLDCVSETYRSWGIAVVDRIAFGREAELLA